MFDFFKGTVTSKDWMVVAGVVAAVGLVAIAFYFLLYQPKQEDLMAVQTELDKVAKDLKAAQQIAADIEALREEAESMQTLVTMFEERLPEDAEIPALLNKFESLGHDLGLRLELTTLPTRSDGKKQTIPYHVTAWGNFHQIASFINLLERDERYLKVSDIDIGEQELGVSEAVFTLSTFRFIKGPGEVTQ